VHGDVHVAALRGPVAVNSTVVQVEAVSTTAQLVRVPRTSHGAARVGVGAAVVDTGSTNWKYCQNS
jgi:hypothetical protein